MPDPQIGKKLNKFEEAPTTEADNELIQYVLAHCDQWRTNRNSNYLLDWKEYERMFRGTWAAEDKPRDSERSRIVTPAMQQAIESKQA